jgi:MFS family permease
MIAEWISMKRSDDQPRTHSSLRVLAQRNFGPYFVGNLLSNCGTWFQNIAQALLIYRLTGSTFMVGLSSFSQFAGTIFLAPWSGAAADRFDRKRLIIGTQVGAMVVTGTLAFLAAFNLDTVPIIIALALLLGFVTAFGSPAMNAIVPSLVNREDLGAAIAMNSVTFNLSRAVGPVLGALVVARLGIPWAFGINCISFAALIGALLITHPYPQGERPRERPKLTESLRLVRADLRLVALLAVVSSVSFALDPVTTLAPAFATQVFHRSDTLAGLLIGAFGAGAVIAALFATGPSTTPYRRIAVMLALLSGGIIAYALSPVLALAFFALATGGFGYLAGQTRATTLVQLGVPDNQRGRIMALWSVCFLGSRPIASLIDGSLASIIGIHVTAIVMTIPTIVTATLMTVIHLRQSRVDRAAIRAEREVASGSSASHG